MNKAEKDEAKLDAFIAGLPRHMQPLDQGSTREEMTFPHTGHEDFYLWRRWPWFVYWLPNGKSIVRPPWFDFVGYLNAGDSKPPHKFALHAAIARCLKYCLENAADLPRFAPVMDIRAYHRFEEATELPAFSRITSDWIPRGIVRKYPMARCGEAIAYVFQFSSGPETDAIRRLIIAPTPEKIAEAYAIATGHSFRKSPTLIEWHKDMDEARKPLSFDELCKKYGLCLVQIIRVFEKLYNSPDATYAVLELARIADKKKPSGGGRGGASAALKKLEGLNLARRIGNRWTLGEAARV
jgi:hypothetical protein